MTCTDTFLVTERPPPVAVIVTVAEASGAVAADFSVKIAEASPKEAPGVTGSALQAADTPCGNPLMERLTTV